ncbi:MAG: hypothetical protein FD167_5348, partial [bacterium]
MLCRKLFNLLFVVFLFVPFVSALDVEFNLSKDYYRAYETIQFQASFSSINLTKELQISNLFLVNRNGTSFSISKNIIKLDNQNYIFY